MEDNKDIIGGILRNSSERKAPAGMSQRIVDAWKVEQKVPVVIAPLIPKWVWWLIASLLIAMIALTVKLDKVVMVDSPVSEFMRKLSNGLDFEIHLHPVMMISIVTMSFMIGINAFFLGRRGNLGSLSMF